MASKQRGKPTRGPPARSSGGLDDISSCKQSSSSNPRRGDPGSSVPGGEQWGGKRGAGTQGKKSDFPSSPNRRDGNKYPGNQVTHHKSPARASGASNNDNNNKSSGSGSGGNDGSIIVDKKTLSNCVGELMKAIEAAKADASDRKSQQEFMMSKNSSKHSGSNNNNSNRTTTATVAGTNSSSRVVGAKGNPKISYLVERICSVRLPMREPSWAKEIATAILTICYTPTEWLSPLDYANLSRLVTRASSMKQLTLNGTDIVAVFAVLSGFIRTVGVLSSNCVSEARSDSETGAAAAIDGADDFSRSGPSPESVLHEVLRAFAQLSLVNNPRVMRYRVDSLELLVKVCHPRNPLDIDSRHAAVDALGNMLRVVADEEALVQPFRDEDVGLDADPQLAVNFAYNCSAIDGDGDEESLLLPPPSSVEELKDRQVSAFLAQCKARGEDIVTDIYVMDQVAKDAVYRRFRKERLLAVQDQAVYILLENLKLCIAKSGGAAAEVSSKLLVSCLRAVAQAVHSAAASGEKSSSNSSSSNGTATITDSEGGREGGISLQGQQQAVSKTVYPLKFQPHLQSLTQSAYYVLTKLLPAVVDLDNACLDSRSKSSAAGNAPVSTATSGRGGLHAAIRLGISPEAETKIWTHALRLMSAVAQYDPHALLASWPLFLSDSQAAEKTLASTLQCMIDEQAAAAGGVDNAGAHENEALRGASAVVSLATSRLAHIVQTAIVTTTPPTMYSLALFPPMTAQSPLLLPALWAKLPAVRAAAVDCLHNFIKGLPLEKWMMHLRSGASNRSRRALPPNSATAKTTATILKIARVLVVLMSTERDESVVLEVCRASSVLVKAMPLQPAAAVVSSSSGKKGGNIPLLEDLVSLLFREAMVMSAESIYVKLWLDSTSGGGQKSSGKGSGAPPAILSESELAAHRQVTASTHAMTWLADICSSNPPLECFRRALESNSYRLRDRPSSDIRCPYSHQSESSSPGTAGGGGASLRSSPLVHASDVGLALCAEQAHVDHVSRALERACHVDTEAILRAQADMAACAESRNGQKQQQTSTSTGTTAESSNGSSRGGQTYMAVLRALNILCTLPPLAGPADPAGGGLSSYFYFSAARTLQCSLIQLYPHSYAQSREGGPRMQVLEACYSPNAHIKLMGVKMLSSLLAIERSLLEEGGHTSRNTSRSGSSRFSLKECIVILLKSSCHRNHQIRGQAVASFGLLTATQWEELRQEQGFVSYRSDCLPHGACEELGIDTSVRAAVLQCMLTCCGDSVGTVRTNAQKSLGEAILAGGILAPVSSFGHIFVTSGTNDVSARLEQAREVQEHARSAALEQEKRENYKENRSLSQRLTDAMLSQSLQSSDTGAGDSSGNSAQGGRKGRAANGKKATTSQQQTRGAAPTTASDATTGKGSDNTISNNSYDNIDASDKGRRSHQIDQVRNYELSAIQVARENQVFTGNSSSNGGDGIDQDEEILARHMQRTVMHGDGTARILLYGDRCVDSESAGAYQLIPEAVLKCLCEGCADSKLGVRLQAIWALGNLLASALTPRLGQVWRLQSWASDEVWSAQVQVCNGLLEDSDKLLSSTARCYGYLCAGLDPRNVREFEIIDDIMKKLVAKAHRSAVHATTSVRSSMTSIISSGHARLTELLLSHPKLASSLCQSLSAIGWILIAKGSCGGDDGGTATAFVDKLCEVRGLQSSMLAHSHGKVRIQASKSLLSLVHCYSFQAPPLDVAVGASVPAAGDEAGVENWWSVADPYCLKHADKIRIMNPTFNGIVPFSDSGSSSSGQGHVQSLCRAFQAVMEAMQTLSTVQLFNKSTTAAAADSAEDVAISRVLLVLLWAYLRRVWHGDGGDVSVTLVDAVVDSLLYYSEELVEWLVKCASDVSPLLDAELSVATVPLPSSAPLLPQNILTNATCPRDLVPVVAAHVLRIVGIRITIAAKDAGLSRTDYEHTRFADTVTSSLCALAEGTHPSVSLLSAVAASPSEKGSAAMRIKSPTYDAAKVARSLAQAVLVSPEQKQQHIVAMPPLPPPSTDEEDEDEI